MWPFLLIIFLIFSCGREEVKQAQEQKERIFPVKVLRASQGSFPLYYSTVGHFETGEKVKVRPEISGIVEKVFIEEGQKVSKGEKLLKIRDTDLIKTAEEIEARIKEEEARLKTLESIYKRREKLFQEGLIGKEEFERVRADYMTSLARLKALKARLEKIKVDLAKTFIRSPVEGIIKAKLVNEGEWVSPQTVLFEIISLKDIRFVFKIPQEIAKHLQIGKAVKISANGSSVEGVIFYISPEADSSRLILVKAKVKDPSKGIFPGSYGEAMIEVGTVEGFRVPERSLQVSGRQVFLWIVKDSRAVKVPVEVISHEGDSFVVRGNIKAGDLIVTDGFMFLYEGARVRVEEYL